jgi:hypothetical protein
LLPLLALGNVQEQPVISDADGNQDVGAVCQQLKTGSSLW